MKEYLKGLPWFLAAVVVLVTIGYLIERWRRRDLEKWAVEQGGKFEGGGILDEIQIPEAAPFDANPGRDRITYNNVTRLERPEATYVLAQYYLQYLDTKNTAKSSSCVVCFVTLPAGNWPEVRVYRPMPDPFGLVDKVLPETPVPVPGASPAFAAAFEARPVKGAAVPDPKALSRLLPDGVQTELLSNESLIAGLRVHGRVVRVQAVGQVTGYPHQKVFEVVRRMTAAWAPSR
jgi:hypothetical protein